MASVMAVRKNKLSKEIAKLALQSRLLVIFLQFVANVLLPDHDAGVFSPPVVDQAQFTTADKVLMTLLGGFRRWDALYFLHIAQHGYTYENCVAFFPLYPLIIASSQGLAMLFPHIISLTSLFLVSGVFVNVVLFVISAVILLHLGLKVTEDENLAYLAAVLFCVNPASIFMTAPYTEALFACLSFAAMLSLRDEKLLRAVLLVGASTMTRSNGVVSFGFIAHFLAGECLRSLIFTYRVFGITWNSVCTIVGTVTVTVVRTLTSLVGAFSPFVLFQMFIYDIFCFSTDRDREVLDPSVVSYGHKEGYNVLGGEDSVSPWCYDSLPLPYSYIQSQHWGVGFLRYYQLKQIPNFILAAPVVGLSLWACCSFCLHRPDACRTLGLLRMNRPKVETVGSCEMKEKCGWYSAHLVVYIIHLLFLTGFGCCFMHIQVMTRFLCSSSPVIYWFTAHRVMCSVRESTGMLPDSKLHFHSLRDLLALYRQCSVQGKCILAYFVGYLVVGTVAFSNFLPWT